MITSGDHSVCISVIPMYCVHNKISSISGGFILVGMPWSNFHLDVWYSCAISIFAMYCVRYIMYPITREK